MSDAAGSTARSPALQAFIDAAGAAFRAAAPDAATQRLVERVFSALAIAGPAGRTPAARRPVCAHLEAALAPALADPALTRLAAAFQALEPALAWRPRGTNPTASPNFPDGHANALIVGPGGHEARDDAWLGVTLMAPQVRYPDHDHPPEEAYLVLSDSQFQHGKSDWFAPGIGGSFHNTPGIRHAMRSGATPLLALWILRPDPSDGSA